MSRTLTVKHGYLARDDEENWCGHWVQLFDDGAAKAAKFFIGHYIPAPDDETPIDFARECIQETFGEEYVKDLDWENSDVREFLNGCPGVDGDAV